MVAVAIGGAAIVGAGSSIISGNAAAKAQKKAAQASADVQQYMYDTTRSDFAPWRDVGQGALNKLAGMYGVSTGTGGTTGGTSGASTADSAPYGGFEASPGYQWRLDQGVQATERSAASRGLLGSGATMKAVQRYGEGLASSEYENYANRLASLAGVGQAATNSTAAAGQSAATGISNAYTQQGNATASSYLNAGNAVNQGLSNALSGYLRYG